jgi:hypothetical protein
VLFIDEWKCKRNHMSYLSRLFVCKHPNKLLINECLHIHVHVCMNGHRTSWLTGNQFVSDTCTFYAQPDYCIRNTKWTFQVVAYRRIDHPPPFPLCTLHSTPVRQFVQKPSFQVFRVTDLFLIVSITSLKPSYMTDWTDYERYDLTSQCSIYRR